MHEYDKSSKWLIQHHGDSILRRGGVRGIVSWRALQAARGSTTMLRPMNTRTFWPLHRF
jgi:hypothetical protein